jgi:membrane carboxypeptidase/penicillin-binding protein
MVNAYSILANQGRALNPATLIDFVQDRHGKVIWPENWRPCDAATRPTGTASRCRARRSARQAGGRCDERLSDGPYRRGRDPARHRDVLRDLDRPMFGKTGTNSGPTDVWFVGGTPQMIGGVYIGYDTPTNLGGYAQGGTIAAPIFKEFAIKAYEGMEKIPFARRPASAWSGSTAPRASRVRRLAERAIPRRRSSGKRSSPRASRAARIGDEPPSRRQAEGSQRPRERKEGRRQRFLATRGRNLLALGARFLYVACRSGARPAPAASIVNLSWRFECRNAALGWSWTK